MIEVPEPTFEELYEHALGAAGDELATFSDDESCRADWKRQWLDEHFPVLGPRVPIEHARHLRDAEIATMEPGIERGFAAMAAEYEDAMVDQMLKPSIFDQMLAPAKVSGQTVQFHFTRSPR